LVERVSDRICVRSDCIQDHAGFNYEGERMRNTFMIREWFMLMWMDIDILIGDIRIAWWDFRERRIDS